MYNDPTNPNPYPYQPNPYQQQLFQAPPPPSRRSFKQWYQAQRRRTQVGLGCGVIVAALLMCSCIGSFAAANTNGQASSAPTTSPTTNPNNGQAIVDITATAQPAQQQAAPTVAPTKAQPTPKPQPTHAAQPTPKPKPSCNAVNGNPWCYNFSPGKLITVPPSNFCSYFNCIASFYSADDPDGGYIVECQDGTYSQSGGESGSCSHHGGNLRPLYSH